MRLTGSGLGCPTWPECVPGSFTPVRTDESSIHDLVEFGNRLPPFAVVILAIAALYSVADSLARPRSAPVRRRRRPRRHPGAGDPRWHHRADRPQPLARRRATSSSRWCSSPSRPLSCGATARDLSGPGELLVHPRRGRRPRHEPRRRRRSSCSARSSLGRGPHSGDADAPARTGFDPRVVSWLHARRRHAFSGLVVATLVAVLITARPTEVRRAWWVVLGVTLAQAVIGYVQYFTACRSCSCCSTCSVRACSSPPSRGACSRPAGTLSDRTTTVGWFG